MNKQVERIRAKIERLKSNLVHGACSSQIAMETRCKEEAYNEVLTLLNTMQEGFVSEKKCMFTKDSYTDEDRKVLCDGCEEECEYNKEEPVSDDLEKAYTEYADERLSLIRPDISDSSYSRDRKMSFDLFDGYEIESAFEDGAQWQKENLWKPADGNDLPEIDREVIALLDNGKVVFAHRPPEYWDGKNIITGKVTRNYPKTYDKGGWNIPDVKFWLDVELPKEIEL